MTNIVKGCLDILQTSLVVTVASGVAILNGSPSESVHVLMRLWCVTGGV